MRNAMIAVIVSLAVSAGAACSGPGTSLESISISVMPVIDPNLLPGLAAYKVTLVEDGEETVYAVKTARITGVHQVHMGAAQTPWEESWAAQPAALRSAQLANDSYFLLEPDAPLGNDTLPDIGTPTETNDGTNPTGGAIDYEVQPGQTLSPATLGMGSIDQTLSAIGLDLNYRASTLDLTYVVVPAGSVALLSAEFADGESLGEFVDDYPIPEPATLAVLARGAAALRRRRSPVPSLLRRPQAKTPAPSNAARRR